MRKLVVIEFVSLDGVMQGLRSPDEDRDGGFEHVPGTIDTGPTDRALGAADALRHGVRPGTR
jgi:hypothetical protein